MKTRSLVLIAFSVLMTQAVFAQTTCVSRPNLPDGTGGYISGFDCSLYREAVYPFNLTGYITNGGASLSENAIVPGYIVFTTDATDVAGQTLNDPGAFQDILDFVPNQCAGTCSTEVSLFWPAIGFPSVAAIQAGGYLVLLWKPSGVEMWDPDANHTYTIFDSFGLLLPTSPLVADFQVKYAANLSIGDSYFDLQNTGNNGDPALGPGIIPGLNVASGNLCVNVYAIDPNEELISCCSCLITPGQTVSLTALTDLANASVTTDGIAPVSISVKLISSLAGTGGSSTSCSSSAALISPVSTTFPLAFTGGLASWGTTLHPPAGLGGPYVTTETPFTPATLSVAELTSLTGRCASIIGNLSGHGQCISCGPFALGAKKM